MQKLCILFVGASMIGLTGCISDKNSIPGREVGLNSLPTTATYDIIGDATGTATGGTLFWFINVGGEKKYGKLQTGSFGAPPSPVEQAAMYNAIESVPTADSIMAPRFSKKVSNYVVYKEETVTVKGKAIRYNKSAD